MTLIRIHPEVEDALRRGSAVVALESAVITHGLPREPLDTLHRSRVAIEGWAPDSSINLELARAMQRTVRGRGATPATIAVVNGELHIGLDEDELASLAEEQCAEKASLDNLACIMSRGGNAGTTVSATLTALKALSAALRDRQKSDARRNPTDTWRLTPHTLPIRVIATGGIGGIHRQWQEHLDISADLCAMAAAPVCVVCSGAKSILDLQATLEALQALGMPVIGYRTSRFPQFQCKGSDDLPLAQQVDSVEQVAQICITHWQALGLSSGTLLANEVPGEHALEAEEFRAACAQAERLAATQHITGSARTPFLLDQIARLTSGRSLVANIALLLSNAKLAADLAKALASHFPR
jgi:pseudouridine-5'-phosphate glycosidase